MHSDRGLWQEAGKGATDGLLATLAMSAAMFGIQKLGVYGRQPPERIVEETLNVGVERGERTENAVRFGPVEPRASGERQPTGR